MKNAVATMTLIRCHFPTQVHGRFPDRGKFTVLQYTKKILSVAQIK